MEEWQMEWIVANGPRLYSLTDVTPGVLNKLCSKKILDQDDVNELDRIGKHEKDGVAVQKSELYSKLMKKDCYSDLIEVLRDCKLYGAANLLDEGKEANQRRNVQNVDQIPSPELGENEAKVNLLLGKIIKAELSYYIPRSIRSRFVLSKEVIFHKDTKDILLFTGIKQNELSSYLGLGQCSSDKSGRQVAQTSLSVRHILLETTDHFQMICELAKETCAVHWIHHENGRFVWVKSGNGKMSTIQKAIKRMKKENEVFSETDFLAHLDMHEKKYGNSPVVIADTPGMGKSELLLSLARQIVRGKRTVILVVISELMNLIKKNSRSSQLSNKHFEEALIQLSTESSGVQNHAKHMKTLLQSTSQDGVTLELMLDGFDEISSKDLPLAQKIFSLVRKSYSSTRIWVATRPHLLHDLENELNVTGFTILPFQESDQVQFLVSFWHSKICKNVSCNCLQADSKCSDVDLKLLVTKVAKHCLTTLKSTCSRRGSKGRDICGVPLQCLMLAEVFQKDCLNFVNKGNWTSNEEPTLSLKITSIKDLYEELINVKFNKFAERYYSKQLRPKRRIQLINQHVYLALQLLFQTDADDFVEALQIERRNSSSPPALNSKDILNVGIVEDFCGADNLAHSRFIHRTLAEFLVARFIVEQLCPAVENESSRWRKLCSQLFKLVYRKTSFSIQSIQHLDYLLRDEVFQTENQDLDMEPSLDEDETFVHDVVVFFIDSLLEGRNIAECTRLRELIPSSSKGYIVAAGVVNDLFNIFRILVTDEETGTPSTYGLRVVDILEAGVKYASLDFFEVIFAMFYDSWEEEELRKTVQKAGLLEFAVRRREYSAVDYLLNSQRFGKLVEDFVPPIRALLHELVRESIEDCDWHINEKLESLTRLVQLQPKLLEWKSGEQNGPPILQCCVHVELTLKLIELGANPLARDDNNSTLLHFCHNLSGKEFHRVVTRLSEKRQVLEQLVNAKTKRYEKSVLHEIAKFIKQPEKFTLECLLSHGADFTAIDQRGCNCLHTAAKYGNMGAARVLLEFEIVRKLVNERNKEGKQPLDVLMTSKRKRLKTVEEFGKLLVENGARLSRDSILHEVLSKEELPLDRAQLLLDVYKVDVNGLDDDGNTPLHICFNYLDCWDLEKRVRVLLEKGANLKLLNRENLTPLQILVREAPETDESSLNALSLLEEYGALEGSPEMAQLALNFAVKGRSWSIYEKFEKLVEKLSSHGAKVENISLEECALNGWTLGVRYLLEKRANNINLNERNARGDTILHLYMSSKKPISEVVELLLAKGAHVGTLDETGETHLERRMNSSRRRLSIEMLEMFVTHGAAKSKSPEVANKILFHLVDRWADEDEMEGISLAEKVVSEGGDVHATDQEGSGLLHRAATKGCLPMLRFLVGKGVDVNVRNGKERTPLHCALRRRGFDVMSCVDILKELGADLEAVDNENQTMLHFSAKHQTFDVVEYFLETKLFDNLLTDGEFLLDVISSAKLRTLKELFSRFSGTSLQDVGSTSTNPERCSILHVAVNEGDVDLVEYLLENKLFVLFPLSEDALHRFGNLLQICVRNSGRHKSRSTEEEKSKILKLLVHYSNKELLNTKDDSGRTCLHENHVSPRLLQTLIELGADVNCEDGNGKTVVHVAKEYMTDGDYTEFVDFLQSQGDPVAFQP